MAKIEQAKGLGLQLRSATNTGSPFEGAGGYAPAAMAHATSEYNKTHDPRAVEKAIVGGVDAINKYDAQQALKRVAAGGMYNDSGNGGGSVWDKVSRTMQHLKDGSVGQHANDNRAIRSTPMDGQRGNVTISPDGTYSYDPNAANRNALDQGRITQQQQEIERNRASINQAQAPRVNGTIVGGKFVPKTADPSSATTSGQGGPAAKPGTPTNLPSEPPMPVRGSADVRDYKTNLFASGDTPNAPQADFGGKTDFSIQTGQEPVTASDFLAPQDLSASSNPLGQIEEPNNLFAGGPLGSDAMFGPSAFNFDIGGDLGTDLGNFGGSMGMGDMSGGEMYAGAVPEFDIPSPADFAAPAADIGVAAVDIPIFA